jgi:guanylate kinase
VSRLLGEVEGLTFSVSYTTRKPRGSEVEGEAYHFIDRTEFERRLKAEEFLESADVFGNYYGTHAEVLEAARKDGKDLVLDIDVQGAAQLKKRIPDAVSIFVLPPSREILEQRLRARSQDAEETIQRRLANAAQEIRNYRLYDYVLVNNDLNLAVETLKAIVRAERVRRIRVEEKIQPILDTFGRSEAPVMGARHAEFESVKQGV